VAELTVRCVLRIISVVTVLLGVTWAVATVLVLANANRMTNGVLDGNALLMALIVPVVVLGEGLTLWLVSTPLARAIVR
jgi:ABC-type spermidine/putrescine transport system permease subunit II